MLQVHGYLSFEILLITHFIRVREVMLENIKYTPKPVRRVYINKYKLFIRLLKHAVKTPY